MFLFFGVFFVVFLCLFVCFCCSRILALPTKQLNSKKKKNDIRNREKGERKEEKEGIEMKEKAKPTLHCPLLPSVLTVRKLHIAKYL